MQLIDTHAHIYKKVFQHDLNLILAQATQNHITDIYMPNIDETTIAPMMEVAQHYPHRCLPMMGIHPCHITPNFTHQLYLVETWLSKKNNFIAIGEIGIDLYHDTTLCSEQKEAFAIQLQLAKQYDLPVVIHARNSFKEVTQLLTKAQEGTLKGVIHCFTGNLTEAKTYLALGFSLGIGGILTLSGNRLAETIAAIDLRHMVLETDSPYVTPLPHRGKRNEPSYLRYTAEKLAILKQTTLAEVAAITTHNAIKIFRPNFCTKLP